MANEIREAILQELKLRVMRQHERVRPDHYRGTKMIWNNGPALNIIVARIVNDPREVKVGRLEAR